MQTFAHPIPQQANGRLVMLSVVGAVHVVLIYALLVTLGYVPVPAVFPPTNFHFIPDKAHPQPPPPPPTTVTMIKPTTDSAPVPPRIPVDNGPQTGGITTIPDGGSATVVHASTDLAAVASTHTIPDYPALDKRLSHEGKVRIRLTVDVNGAVSDATVEQSSGFETLDAAAVAWVKAHWRYSPATQDGKPVPATTRANVTFKLTQG